eukprot:354954_1
MCHFSSFHQFVYKTMPRVKVSNAISSLSGSNRVTVNDHPEESKANEVISGELHMSRDDGFACVNSVPSPSILTEATTMDSTENKQNINDESESVATNSTAMELLQFACEGLCFEKYVPSELFYCLHPDCQQEQQAPGATRKLFCEECGAFSHKKKSHSFNRPTNHVKCLDEAMNPESADTEQYNYGRNIATAMKRFKNLKQVMSNERWFSGATCSAISACGPAIALPAAAAAGFAVGLVVVGILPVIGIGLATATEWILIDKQLKIKKISKEEATRLNKCGCVANCVTTGTTVTCMAIGAALGFPLGPIGWVVGAFIGGIAFGLGSRYLSHRNRKKEVEDEQKKRNKIQKEALDSFFHDENYDISDPNKFNERKLKQTYRRLAVIFHPDMKDGDYEQWYNLSKYYGVLIAIFEAQEEEDSDADMDLQQEQEHDASRHSRGWLDCLPFD